MNAFPLAAYQWGWRRLLPEVLVVLMAGSFGAESFCAPPYTTQVLEIKQKRAVPKLQRFLKDVIANNVPQPYRRAARDLRLNFPMQNEGTSSLCFYSIPAENTVVLPVPSLQLLDDLLVATAWLEENGFQSDSVLIYVAALKYGNPDRFPGGRLAVPLTALGIPENHETNMAAMDQADKLYGSAIAWIIAHEVGHVVYQHTGGLAIPKPQALRQEQEADAFATATLRNMGVAPVGMVPAFMYLGILDANRYDFRTASEWREHLEQGRTHPISSDRLRRIADDIRTHSDEYIKAEPKMTPQRIRFLGLRIEAVAQLAESEEIHQMVRGLGESATPELLQPSRERSALVTSLFRSIAL